MSATYMHWRLDREADGVTWLRFDKAGSNTNTYSGEALAEFEQILDRLDRERPKGLIIASAKSAGFIAGADIEEFTRIDSGAEARRMVERGWALFNRLAEVGYPTLALIRGHCMGGGLEMSLACRYRIAVDEPGTRMALPEVMLGIVPAWGGMLRLPRTIGPAAALDLMLTGKSVNAGKARKLGLVDESVPLRVMDNAARMLVTSGREPRQLSLLHKLMNGPARRLVADKARKQVAAKARREHYPAPYAIIDIWERFEGNALAVPPEDPASLESIFRSPTARNLIRVFFLQERLKGFGKESDFTAKRVHVIGAGVMGGDIAAWCALRGMTVTLQDQSAERIGPAIGRAGKLFARRLRSDKRAQRFAMDRLIADPQGHGVRHADVIIEAIFEDLEVKRRLFADLEARARPDAILATNTSSLRIEDIAEGLARPSRLVGIHFFNPVAMLPLVEVVRGAGTDEVVMRQALAFVRSIDKLPLPVESAPGFLVNAVLGPYMLEAMRCVDEGTPPEVVDKALVDFGMPMGPIELVDTVGLDIAMAAGKALTGGAAATPPRRLAELVAAGMLGRKSGRGFYRWEDGKAQKETVADAPPRLADRIIEPLLAAARRCVEAGVVADAELADAGVIFGTGFAPFTGGPLHFAESRGDAPPVPAPAPADDASRMAPA
ncbi:MAG: enoyl-CoA hydratase/isomerase family protein [Rhodocyclaceae bacterium]|nr:enoyl-CoA hydratase/isomerase family protein [Rhodocyclaceae bacterium]